jgi:hypothetical protein
MFCDKCQPFCDSISQAVGKKGLVDGKLVWTPVLTKLHHSIDSLINSSDEGCSICRNIWHSWTDKEQHETDKRSSVYIEVVVDQKQPVLKATVETPEGVEVIKGRMIAIYLGQTKSGVYNLLSVFDSFFKLIVEKSLFLTFFESAPSRKTLALDRHQALEWLDIG